MFQTPLRRLRIEECPAAPKKKKVNDARRASYFEVKPVVLFDNLDNVKIQMVKNYLTNSSSGSFRHSKELSDKVVEILNCLCERISEDTCVYTRK